MPFNHYITTLSAVLLLSTSATNSWAQSDPSGFCPNGQLSVEDGVQICHELDTLSKIIADMERIDRNNNPLLAGSEGDRDALRELPDISPESVAIFNDKIIELQARHAALTNIQRDTQNQLNYDLLGFVLSQRTNLIPYDMSRIPFTNDSGFFNELSYIARQTRFNTVSDYEAYAARLTKLPKFFSQHRANMQRGIETGFTASVEIVPGIIDVIETLSDTPVTDHPFFLPFTRFPDTISSDDQTRLKNLGVAAMESAVIPAYENLLKFFEKSYLPAARKQPGLSAIAGGRDIYPVLVKHFTTLEMTPDEVHEIGLKEVSRIRSEMDIIIREDLEFNGSFAEFLDFLRTDPQFYATSEEELLKEAAWMAKQIDGQMPKFFGTLPRLSYGVIPVPKEIAPTYTTGRYWNGNAAQGLAGNYVVNTYDLSQRPLYNLASLTLHEGVPGHHHQISLSQELKNVPKFRQTLYPGAFGEGWGLYAEKLGVEMGLYKTPYENFGRLTYEMWRACRLVVDTGLHWKGWTREQAEACFFENSALAPHNIRTEVERYISWPGQALSYKIGELKILELRRRAEVALGQNFSIREFHDAVLLDGGVPLNILEAKIDRWIEEKISSTSVVTSNSSPAIGQDANP